ncbi:Sequestosome-1 [Caligus rogercresseyi]|uniref:Sequestosome-1 n=1 Tax=Caligus rogercresseyi TaxID=217165 RepID=A0A7T8GKE3_CALRO|nr:Sequestosome-1 [Caligus rogercresseyi]QQP31516.1 Sequestosome-1 [Caligus rogercresseyi]QQP31517.1 Sequestosome-1 [Caligus rogercresseyi]QQP31518.1 Sequestosome-1 [Caligus rogercresseyi]QQP31519.1 Sequestosome-1 [Caligus rogercresseyi]
MERQFKISIFRPGVEEPEYRRFSMREPIRFGQFRSKIYHLFNPYLTPTIRILWTDKDGDDVTVRRENEFFLALDFMDDTSEYIFKLYLQAR